MCHMILLIGLARGMLHQVYVLLQGPPLHCPYRTWLCPSYVCRCALLQHWFFSKSHLPASMHFFCTANVMAGSRHAAFLHQMVFSGMMLGCVNLRRCRLSRGAEGTSAQITGRG